MTPAQAGAPDRKNILFVDDEPFILTSIRRSILAMTDEWNLFFANSGAEALAMCDGQAFDLIVTDAKMPRWRAASYSIASGSAGTRTRFPPSC